MNYLKFDLDPERDDGPKNIKWMPGEHWKPYPPIPQFWVSDMGRLYNTETGRLSRYPNSEYFLRVLKHGHHRMTRRWAWNMVVETWMKLPAGYNKYSWRVEHLNENTYDNRLANLRVVEVDRKGRPLSEEAREKIRTRFKERGHPRSKGTYLIEGKPYRTLAEAGKAHGLRPMEVWRRIDKWEGWTLVPHVEQVKYPIVDDTTRDEASQQEQAPKPKKPEIFYGITEDDIEPIPVVPDYPRIQRVDPDQVVYPVPAEDPVVEDEPQGEYKVEEQPAAQEQKEVNPLDWL